MSSRAWTAAVAAGALALLGLSVGGQAPQPDERARAQAASQRAMERIRALQRESDALAAEERTLLAQLRKIEIDRAIRVEELTAINADLADTRAALRDAEARAAALGEAAASQRPLVEARLVQLYKLGRAGYWRLLLDAHDLLAVGRAYRTAAALLQIDRQRIDTHTKTLAALAREREELATRARSIEALQQRAAQARAAADRAVALHSALITAIDEQRDLNAQMAGELEAARLRLERTVGQLGSTGTPALLPLKGFRGALPWPADGVLLFRFGSPVAGAAPGTTRNGIEISMAEGRHARAVHEGRVAYAAPFSGYGNLVILEHGDESHSMYGHLRMLSVEQGERVDAGETLGETGRNPSGNPSLYFELRVDGKPVDPLQWLRKQP